MVVENIFDSNTYQNMVTRINSLGADNPRLWGKMSMGQMLAHLTEALKVVTDDKRTPRMFLGRLIGWAFKKEVYNNNPIKKNLPTTPTFLIVDEKNIEEERRRLLQQLSILMIKGEDGIHNIAHPFFGRLTGEQWGKGIWKHFNHHLQQFGA